MTLNLYWYYKYYLMNNIFKLFNNKLILFFQKKKKLYRQEILNIKIFYLFLLFYHIDIVYLYVLSLSDSFKLIFFLSDFFTYLSLFFNPFICFFVYYCFNYNVWLLLNHYLTIQALRDLKQISKCTNWLKRWLY